MDPGSPESTAEGSSEEQALYQEFLREKARIKAEKERKEAEEREERRQRQDREQREREAEIREQQARVAAELRAREEEAQRAAAAAAAALHAERERFASVRIGSARVLLVEAYLLIASDAHPMPDPAKAKLEAFQCMDPAILAAEPPKDDAAFAIWMRNDARDPLIARLATAAKDWFLRIRSQGDRSGEYLFGKPLNLPKSEYECALQVWCQMRGDPAVVNGEVNLRHPSNVAIAARNEAAPAKAAAEHQAACDQMRAANAVRHDCVATLLAAVMPLGFTITQCTTRTQQDRGVHTWTLLRNPPAPVLLPDDEHTLRKAIGTALELGQAAGIKHISCA